MNFKRLLSSTSTYIILSIIAIGILLLTASISYRQFKVLQKSSNFYSHTQEVDREIRKLFANYPLMESAVLRTLILKDNDLLTSWEFYKPINDSSLKYLDSLTLANPYQQQNLRDIKLLSDSLYDTFQKISDERTTLSPGQFSAQGHLLDIAQLIGSIETIKDNMVFEEQFQLGLRKQNYEDNILLTPQATLLIALMSLGIFVLSFRKIYRDRKKIIRTETFLQNILRSTNHIMSHFEPIYDKDDELIDFTIYYTNDEVKSITGNTANDIFMKPVSEIYPFIFKNGVFEILKECMIHNKTTNYSRSYIFNGERMWFDSTAMPQGTGITITSWNCTKEKSSQSRLKQLNDQLQIQNSILINTKNIAKIGSYRWSLKTNNFEFSDNLFHLLGCKNNEFEPSFDDFQSFIHPDDLNKFKKHFFGIIKSKRNKDFNYRIISKKGKTLNLFSRSHVLLKGEEEIVIGVVQDITKQINNKLKLKKKNQELKRSNAELKSFSRVASHDLQEPLRKIQIFISRLTELEENNLSEKGKDYFKKIHASASRMQSLIKFLLTYSHINDTLEVMTRVDLKDILEKVKEDQAITISESGCEINYNNLPAITGIPYQIEQLFNNIISNAIKYGPKKGHPTITIKSSEVKSDKINEEFLKPANSYKLIVIKDNGIGFDMVNSNKIFGLFQRLHQRHEYVGTGIGLAICKKIVENHNGYIKAVSQINIGTSFYIYLPI